MKLHKFSESILIHQTSEFIFDYTQNYNNRLRWDTFLTEARLINDATKADKGVKAWCVAKNGLGMETEYISFNRPHGVAIKMTKGPYLFKHFFGSWTFQELRASTTRVTFIYSFLLRFPFSLVSWLIKQKLRNNIQKRLADLKHCIEEKNIFMI